MNPPGFVDAEPERPDPGFSGGGPDPGLPADGLDPGLSAGGSDGFPGPSGRDRGVVSSLIPDSEGVASSSVFSMFTRAGLSMLRGTGES